jgi:hypothetical protein
VRSSEKSRRRKRQFAVAIGAGLLVAPLARAAPEEIQVYEDDLDKTGQFGLDIHNNYVLGKHASLDYSGEQTSDKRFRFTPEFSYGLTSAVELGLYLPLAELDRNDHFTVDGAKARIKYIVPHPAEQAFYYGANFEIGHVDHRLDQNPWNAELKGIAGWRRGPWDVAFNVNLDFAVSGPNKGPGTVQLATKADYKVTDKLALGIESYDGAGDIHHLGQFAGAGHSIFATADTSIGPWDLNLGVGRGYSGEPDKWIFKVIISVPIDR